MTFWMTHPGKKLLFMGQEFASFSEWDANKELDWNLFDYPAHRHASRFFKDLARVYHAHDALYARDHHPSTFEWLVVDDRFQSVFAYLRKSSNENLLVVLNMTPNVHETYQLGVPKGTYQEILNSDKEIYHGSDQYNGLDLSSVRGSRNGQPEHIEVKLGPFAAMVFRQQKKD
jgi:1,4-alpha-glucan branching enzyme